MGWVRQPRARFRVQKEGRRSGGLHGKESRRSGGLGRRVEEAAVVWEGE